MGLGLESSIRKNLIKNFFFQKYDKVKVKQQNEENHVPAVELLKDRCSNSQVLISPYMKKFVLLPKVKNEDDIKGL